jgi:hypothetical protein
MMVYLISFPDQVKNKFFASFAPWWFKLLVRSPEVRNKITTLSHDTSLLDTRAILPDVGQVSEKTACIPAAMAYVANRNL